MAQLLDERTPVPLGWLGAMLALVLAAVPVVGILYLDHGAIADLKTELARAEGQHAQLVEVDQAYALRLQRLEDNYARILETLAVIRDHTSAGPVHR